jgi:protein gp37
MGKITGISWTDHTFQPWWGCTRVSPGCANCYAERYSKRWGFDIWGPDKPRRFFGDKHWAEPLTWNRAAERDGVRRRVFCASMADVFEEHVGLDEQRARLWQLIEKTKSLDWLILTKRPENIERMLPQHWSSFGYFQLHNELPDGNPFPRNVWLGITAENNDQFRERWLVLENVGRHWYVPVLFISAEPLLGPINMTDYLEEFIEHEEDNTIWLRGIDWVIVGGESGPHARPMHAVWARALRDQCQEAGVPYFFKQWGEWLPDSQIIEHDPRHWPRFTLASFGTLDIDGAWNPDVYPAKFPVERQECMYRLGKENAGDLLDGKAWHQFPEVSHDNTN